MKIVTQIAALTTALLIGSATIAAPATDVRAEGVHAIEWSVAPGNDPGAEPTLTVRYETSNTSFSLDRSDPSLAPVRDALAAAGSRGFELVREAGTLACEGTTVDSFSGHGTCRFTADRGFERDLRARNLMPEREGEVLAMALVDVTRGLIDGLTRQHVPPRTADDAIAAAAVEVTPEYVASLQDAGLTLTSIDDAVSCRALDVDAAFVRAMAEAGYPGDADRIVEFKAVGVTPEYARRMTAAAQN